MRATRSLLRQLRRVPGGVRRRAWRHRVATELDRAGILGHGDPAAEARRLASLSRFAAELEGHGLMGPLSVGIERWAPFLRFAGPGHFYSPIPDLAEIDRFAAQIFDRDRASLPGIDLREDAQLARFAELAALVVDVELPRRPTDGWRYHTDNVAFGMGE